jgi:hypothetical protein
LLLVTASTKIERLERRAARTTVVASLVRWHPIEVAVILISRFVSR